VLEQLGGWDERFFLFGEDVDLCRRIRGLGLEVRFAPEAIVRHVEGASAAGLVTLPLLASARVIYARKHHPPLVAALFRAGVALNGLTHALAGRGGSDARRGHVRALLVALGLADDGARALRG
jgi:GT2 family glycosyltransferase